MSLDSPTVATVSVLADGLLALAALTGLVAFVRRGFPASRPVAASVGAVVVTAAAHALAPLVGAGACAAALGPAAALAWYGAAGLWRAEAPPAPAEDAVPRLLDAALAACRDGVVIATTDATGVQ